jgi:hypothetical protein
MSSTEERDAQERSTRAESERKRMAYESERPFYRGVRLPTNASNSARAAATVFAGPVSLKK